MTFYQAHGPDWWGDLVQAVSLAKYELECKGYDPEKMTEDEHGCWFDPEQNIGIAIVKV